MSETPPIYDTSRNPLLVDSDILINHLNGNNTDLIPSLSKTADLHISVLNEYEVLIGIQDPGILDSVINFLNFFEKLPVTAAISRKASEIAASSKPMQSALKPMDVLIAATCAVHKMPLVTNNKKHFKQIKEIVLY